MQAPKLVRVSWALSFFKKMAESFDCGNVLAKVLDCFESFFNFEIGIWAFITATPPGWFIIVTSDIYVRCRTRMILSYYPAYCLGHALELLSFPFLRFALFRYTNPSFLHDNVSCTNSVVDPKRISPSICSLVNSHLCCQPPLQDIQRHSRLFPRA